MRKRELKELKNKTIKELKELIEKMEEELAKLKVEKEGGKLRNISQLREKRRDLARIKTILREKEINEGA